MRQSYVLISRLGVATDDVFDDVTPTLGAVESCFYTLQLITQDIRNQGYQNIGRHVVQSCGKSVGIQP